MQRCFIKAFLPILSLEVRRCEVVGRRHVALMATTQSFELLEMISGMKRSAGYVSAASIGWLVRKDCPKERGDGSELALTECVAWIDLTPGKISQ